MPANQKRSIPKSTSFDKENTPISNPRKNEPKIRPSKSTRFSDRWPILSRIIRSTKSGTALLDNMSLTDPLDASISNENPEDCTSITYPSDDTSTLPSTAYNQPILQASSPRFPSPLSGVCSEGRLLLARHSYPHRGHSQSSLYLQRDFWRKRKDEWDDYECLLYEAGLTLEEAYGGIVEDEHGSSHVLPPHLRTGPWNRRPTSAAPHEYSGSKLGGPAFLNYATYPRLGDLASIRDPFLVSVDTWFSDFPLWTLSKLVWMYDVNYRSGPSARKCRIRRKVNAFAKNFDVNSFSVDALSVSDVSDTTLVETSNLLPRSPGDSLKSPVHSPGLPKKTSSSPASLSFIRTVDDHARPWEVDWFSRWEVLYNQVSLAVDIAASSGNPALLDNASKEAARIILTASSILYDPPWEVDEQKLESDYTDDYRPDLTIPTEYEEDYGSIIPLSESVYRLGAHVDPFSMFSTAIPEPSWTRKRSPNDPGASCRSGDFADHISEGLEQLTIYS